MLTLFFFSFWEVASSIWLDIVYTHSFVTTDDVISPDPVVTLDIDSLFYFSVTFSSKVELEAIWLLFLQNRAKYSILLRFESKCGNGFLFLDEIHEFYIQK